MSTSTEPLTAWEIELADSLLVDVDLTKDVPCQAEGQDCDSPASWFWFHCCQNATYCHLHHERMLKAVETYHPVGKQFECTYCGTYPMPRPVWRPL